MKIKKNVLKQRKRKRKGKEVREAPNTHFKLSVNYPKIAESIKKLLYDDDDVVVLKRCVVLMTNFSLYPMLNISEMMHNQITQTTYIDSYHLSTICVTF